MATPILSRYYRPDLGERIGVRLDDNVHDVTATYPSIGAWLATTNGSVTQAIASLTELAGSSDQVFNAADFENAPDDSVAHWLAPVDPTLDIWASGVTYMRSREARQEESVDGGDVYARVYDAQRPELFFKAHGRDVVGPHDTVGIRADATWSVPEPELTLVMNASMELVGFTVGNDMSSRDIEGENPLYLPQAKVYNRSCAMGQGILLAPQDTWPAAEITVAIERGGSQAFSGTVHTSNIKRTLAELIAYLGKSLDFPHGVALMTGTGVVPPSDFTLAAGDVVKIEIEGVGRLSNTVVVV